MSTAPRSRARGSSARRDSRKRTDREPVRHRRRGRWIALAALVVVGAVVVVGYFTSVFGVSEVRVVGAHTVDASRVRAVAAIAPGTPMLRVDEQRIKADLGAIPRLSGVQVQRSWPSTVVLRVDERSPVAVAPDSGGVRLVDAAGVPFARVAQAPPELPELHVPRVRVGDPTLRAAVAVLGAVPPAVRGDLRAVNATAPGDVRLELAGGREVRWGGANQSARKAAVLPALLSQPGKVYDVASPELPTITRR